MKIRVRSMVNSATGDTNWISARLFFDRRTKMPERRVGTARRMNV